MPRARILLLSTAGAAGLACAVPAHAGCSIATTAVAFGTYDPQVATALDGVGSVTTVCDSASTNNVSVAINGGGSNNVNARRMTSGASTLGYQLYSNSARSTVWGTGGSALSYTGRNRTVTRTIYGRIPARQNVTAGSYVDTLIVTVTF